ncbi:hypothetical protein [Borrelia miyamotoi]|nr:hypothetical protein [Borrelia miyamotoi]BCR21251.1 hypothetical protein BmIO_00662 [Borrelia miyamotoi]
MSYKSKHNLRYWELKPYLGLGIDSVSLLIGTKSDNLKVIEKR